MKTLVTTPSPVKATDILFREGVPAAPAEPAGKVRGDYESLQRSWGSEVLVEGTESVVRAVVLKNLQRIADEPEFREFDVGVEGDPDIGFAQINAIFSTLFVPVRVWRGQDKLYACGNSLFTA